MDEMIFHLINEQWTNPVFDLFMPAISYSDIWTPCFIIAAIAFLIFGGFRGRAFVFCTTFALALSNPAFAPPKHAIERTGQTRHRAPPSEAGADRAHDRTGENPPQDSEHFQETDHPCFYRSRTSPLRRFISIRPHQ